jgi:hypothetical protein
LNWNHTIKSIVSFKVPNLLYENARMIIKRLPVAYAKVKPAEAVPVPDWCVRVMAAAQAQDFSGPLVDQVNRDCVVCYCLARSGQPYHHDDSHIYICQNCGCLWHDLCAEGFAEINGALLDFGAFVCPVCI